MESTLSTVKVISSETKLKASDVSKAMDTHKFELESKPIPISNTDTKPKDKISLELTGSSVKNAKPTKLHFPKDHSKSDQSIPHNLVKAQQQADKAQNNFETAKSKLPSQKNCVLNVFLMKLKAKQIIDCFLKIQLNLKNNT